MLVCIVMTAVILVTEVHIQRLYHNPPTSPPPAWIARMMGMSTTDPHKYKAVDDVQESQHTSQEDVPNVTSPSQLNEVNLKQKYDNDGLEQIIKIVSSVNQQIKYIRSRYQAHDKVHCFKEQWEKVADFLEFVCFWTYIVVMIIYSTLLLVIIPMRKPDVRIEEHEIFSLFNRY